MSNQGQQQGKRTPGQNVDATAQQPLRPGDQAAPGTPGTGENLCPDCSGTGKISGKECATCQGTGRVTEGIGGA
jgi:hypothetical protein